MLIKFIPKLPRKKINLNKNKFNGKNSSKTQKNYFFQF